MTELLAIFKFITGGAVLGMAAGLSPGPLLALIISQTLKHNKKEGMKIALSPLITDLPIVSLSVFAFSKLAQFNIILGIIAFIGGIFIATLGYGTFTTKGMNIETTDNTPTRSLRKGVLTNFLSPNAYLFWITVGAPFAIKALENSLLSIILFFVAFYVSLIGSTITVAWLVSKSKTFMSGKTYIYAMRFLGIVLFFFAIMFFREGFKQLM